MSFTRGAIACMSNIIRSFVLVPYGYAHPDIPVSLKQIHCSQGIKRLSDWVLLFLFFIFYFPEFMSLFNILEMLYDFKTILASFQFLVKSNIVLIRSREPWEPLYLTLIDPCLNTVVVVARDGSRKDKFYCTTSRCVRQVMISIIW